MLGAAGSVLGVAGSVLGAGAGSVVGTCAGATNPWGAVPAPVGAGASVGAGS